MQLNKLYKQIPGVNCKPGCTDCCGPAPFSDKEWGKLPRKFRRRKPANEPAVCRFKKEKGCMIYEYRPTMCRLFGAVDGCLLKCSHGARAEHPLSNKEAQQIIINAGEPCFIG